ncbi:MAG TPA: S49 family peptidase [Arenicellales bacterium]|nr:S49 family peptidase [Arenicellales bacterium]
MLDFQTLVQIIGMQPAALCRDWVSRLPLKGAVNTENLFRAAEQEAAEHGSIEAAIDRRREAAIARRQGAVAVVPVRGVIMPRPNIYELVGWGTSVQTIVAMTRAAVADPEVKAVVQAFDSPGGSSAGLPEGWAELYALRGEKPIVAVAEHLMASAAYWLASAADEIDAAPSALVGSIGVFMLHVEFAQMLEAEGIKPTFIHAGQYKVEGNPFEPLTEEAQAHFQSLVDDTYRQFTADASKGRGVRSATIQGPAFGEGRVLTATAAQGGGMIDKVRSLSQTLEAYGLQRNEPDRGRGASAIERRRRSLALLEQGL